MDESVVHLRPYWCAVYSFLDMGRYIDIIKKIR